MRVCANGFGDADPVGHTITADFKYAKSKLVVGVAKDSKYFTLSKKQRLAVYDPYFAYNEPTNLHFLIRTAGSPTGYVKPITDLLGRFDSTAAIETKPMTQALGLALLPSKSAAVALGALGALGLLLAGIGLYGFLLYSVSRRIREIGLRMALGATSSDVLRLIMRHSLMLVGSGAIAGLALAPFAMQPLALPRSGPQHLQRYSIHGGDWRSRHGCGNGFLYARDSGFACRSYDCLAIRVTCPLAGYGRAVVQLSNNPDGGPYTEMCHTNSASTMSRRVIKPLLSNS